MRITVSCWKPQPRVAPTKLVRVAPGSHFPQFPRLRNYSLLAVCANLDTQHASCCLTAATSAGRGPPCREPRQWYCRCALVWAAHAVDDSSSGRSGSAADMRRSLAGAMRSSCECAALVSRKASPLQLLPATYVRQASWPKHRPAAGRPLEAPRALAVQPQQQPPSWTWTATAPA